MILAASIPHLGQTTPTAAFGLRAIRSLLTPLDAGRPLTVRVSEIDSFRALKFTTFAITSEICKKPPLSRDRCLPDILDTTAGAVTFLWAWDPLTLRCCPPVFDIVVPQWPRIDAIVGDPACKSKRFGAKLRKTGLNVGIR
jgi:hypothetical protein